MSVSLVDRVERVAQFSGRVYRDAAARPLFGASGGHPLLASPPPVSPYMSGATVSALVDAVDQLTKRLSRLESAFVVFESTFHEHFARGVLSSTQNYRAAVQEAMEPLRQATRQHGAVLLDLVQTVNHLAERRAEDPARATADAPPLPGSCSAGRASSLAPDDLLPGAALLERPQGSHGPKLSRAAGPAQADSSSASDAELKMRINRLKMLQREFLSARSFSQVPAQGIAASSSGDNAGTSSSPFDAHDTSRPFRQSMVPLYTTTTSSSAGDDVTTGTNQILRTVRNILRPPESSDSTLLPSSPARGGQGHVTFASDVPGVLSDVSTGPEYMQWRAAAAYRTDDSSHSDAFQELVHRLDF